MANKHGLGRGLSALIPESRPYFEAAGAAGATAAADGTVPGVAGVQGGTIPLVAEIEVGRLRPNPEQPRRTFPQESLDELASSISRHGLLQPIMAEEDGEGGYIIVAGERRWRAAQIAGLEKMPVIVRRLSSDSRLEVSIIENIQREDLNPLEEARAYQSLMELTGRTQDQVAEAVGKSRSAVANALRLLRLPEDMLAALRDGAITAGHARSLLAVQDPAARSLLFGRIVDEGLNVRQAEAMAQGGAGGQGKGKGRKAGKGGREGEGTGGQDSLDPNLVSMRDLLIEAFGTKVDIKGDFDRGSIVVEYYSAEGLQRILDAVGAGG